MFRLRWHHEFPELHSLQDLETVLEASRTSPVLIYKHSLTCGTSAFALEEMTRLAPQRPDLPIHLIPVQTARAVSDEVAARLGVRHESPQALIVSNGRVLWEASHFGLTASGILDALSRLTPDAAPGAPAP